MMMKKPTRVAIAGAAGRMARQLILASCHDNQIELGAVFGRADSSLLGADAGELAGLTRNGVKVSDDFAKEHDKFDVLVDFTSPDGTFYYLDFCRKYKKSMVIGTTGITESNKEKINIASTEIAIVMAANFSLGVTVLIKLLEEVTRVMGNHTDIEITEAHHKYKTDIPSGTALAMAETMASALGKDLKDCITYPYGNNIGQRRSGNIGFTSIRAGDIVGEHTALFIGEGERLEITHKASNRMIFSRGALRAASWLNDKPAGLYSMLDVLEMNGH